MIYVKSPREKRWHVAKPYAAWSDVQRGTFHPDDDWVTVCGSSRPRAADDVCALPEDVALVRKRKPAPVCGNCVRRKVTP